MGAINAVVDALTPPPTAAEVRTRVIARQLEDERRAELIVANGLPASASYKGLAEVERMVAARQAAPVKQASAVAPTLEESRAILQEIVEEDAEIKAGTYKGLKIENERLKAAAQPNLAF